MSDKETELVDLNANLSKEEEDIVDSIISELNDGEGKPSDGPPQMSEEDKQRMMHEQQMMQQQRMMQQQQMMQQQRMMQQQQMMQQPQKEPNEDKKEDKKEESIIDKLKIDLKDPAIVSIIAFILLMPQSDSIVTMTKLEFLLNADGSISIYGYFIKALVAGLLFYLFTKYS
tara:strand:+ start:1073 stop:1588 length:516 start_codon:yes stop_codon:yes gene_type:complete